MEYSAEAVAAVEHELEVADAIRREILKECTEINEMSESYESSLSQSLARGQLMAGEEGNDGAQLRAIAASVKTTPRMLNMSGILYKLRRNDFIIPDS